MPFMKLFATDTSPFARKVLVAARELGLADRIEKVALRPSPLEANPALSAHNPLNKIPALLPDEGSALYDSAVICDYLDTLHDGRKLVPERGNTRFEVLRRQALCDGILEAGILVFYELSMRPQELHWAPWLDGQRQKVRQALDLLEGEAAGFGAEVDLGQICAGVTLGWLEFRKPVGDIRAGRPRLFAWYESFRQRPSMAATAPVG
jgi:glutathione S-transferase